MTPREAGAFAASLLPPITDAQVEGIARILATIEVDDAA